MALIMIIQRPFAGNALHCIWQPAFFWREIILVTSNGIKRRKEHGNLSEESLERSRGRRRRRENFNEEHRKAGRNRARGKKS